MILIKLKFIQFHYYNKFQYYYEACKRFIYKRFTIKLIYIFSRLISPVYNNTIPFKNRWVSPRAMII